MRITEVLNRAAAGSVVVAICAGPGIAHAQWTAASSGTSAEFRGLSVPSARVAWVSGTRGRFARSTNGGRTWRVDSIPGAEKLDLRSIAAIDARTAIVASAGEASDSLARIYRTSDGGATWRLVFTTLERGVFLDAIAFWDTRNGIALSDPVDGRFVILRTGDGGRHWTRVPRERLPEVLPGEAAFAASGSCLTTYGTSHVWIGTGGAAHARVFHSRDRGSTWTVAETPLHAGNPSSGVFSVAFRDARHGIAVGGDYTQPHGAVDNVALTDDGGATWHLATGALPPAYLSAVSFVPGTRLLVAVGLAGTALSRDGGNGWEMLGDSTAYNSVRFLGPRSGIVAGPRGRVGWWSGVSAP